MFPTSNMWNVKVEQGDLHRRGVCVCVCDVGGEHPVEAQTTSTLIIFCGRAPAFHTCCLFLFSVPTTETMELYVFIFLCPFLAHSVSWRKCEPLRGTWGRGLFAHCYVHGTQNWVHTQCVIQLADWPTDLLADASVCPTVLSYQREWGACVPLSGFPFPRAFSNVRLTSTWPHAARMDGNRSA